MDHRRLFNTHDLTWLAGEVERVYELFGWPWNADKRHFKTKDDFRGIIQDLHAIDGRSYAFRYPVDKTGVSALPDSFQFNLFHLS